MVCISGKISQQIVRSALTIVTLLLGYMYACASEDAVDLLMKAYQHSGSNPAKIRSGYAEFKVQTDHRISAEDYAALEKLRKRAEERLKTDISHAPKRPEEEPKRLEEEEKRPDVVSRKFDLSILMLGNDIYFASDGKSSKRRFLTRELVQFPGHPESNVSASTGYVQTISISMGSPNQPDSCITVTFIPDPSRVEYSNEFQDIAEFQLFGRFRELPFSFIHDIFSSRLDRKDFSFSSDAMSHFVREMTKEGLTCEITGEEIYDGSERAKAIEIRKKGVLLEKYLIDSSKGYICPYLFAADGDESGNFSVECVAKNFSMMPGTDLYYPTLFTETSKSPSGESKSTYRLVPESFVLNQSVSTDEFAIDVPADTMVYSRIRDTSQPPLSNQFITYHNTTYLAIEKGVISLTQGGYDLDKMQWLYKEDPLEDYVPPRGGTTGYTRLLLGSIGIVFLLIICLKIYRLWKRQ